MPITPSIPIAIEQWLRTINTTWPAFQIEKDKKYILENGEIIGPMIPTNDNDGFAWKFLRPGTKCHRFWSNKGIRWCVKSRPMENIKSEYIEDGIPIRELGCQADPKLVYEPWDFESMPVAVKVISKNDKDSKSTFFPHRDEAINACGVQLSYSALFRKFTQLDGTPCGRLKS
jgi:hypothetical protein